MNLDPVQQRVISHPVSIRDTEQGDGDAEQSWPSDSSQTMAAAGNTKLSYTTINLYFPNREALDSHTAAVIVKCLI